ncbi:MAG: ppsE7, partial [Chlorobi bacterium]|nr:ppsE7 [Chlorobiota bacterium]
GVEENFFELGGHSLLATQVISRVRSEMEVDISLRDFFLQPTIESLALLIVTTMAGQCDPTVIENLLAEMKEATNSGS